MQFDSELEVRSKMKLAWFNLSLVLAEHGAPNKATKNFRESGSNKAKFWIRQPISSQIRQLKEGLPAVHNFDA